MFYDEVENLTDEEVDEVVYMYSKFKDKNPLEDGTSMGVISALHYFDECKKKDEGW